MSKRKVEKVTFDFSDGSSLEWERLDKPVLSNSGTKMWWLCKSNCGKMCSSGNPSVSYSSWLIDLIEETYKEAYEQV